MKVKVTLNKAVIQRISDAAKAAAVDTMEQLYTDLVKSKTMPFDSGDMQNNQTFVDITESGAVLITGSPQARRLYYHPEYNFKQSEGANGSRGAYWLDTYIFGDKWDFVNITFAKSLKERLGL